jgi:hypothetical protein
MLPGWRAALSLFLFLVAAALSWSSTRALARQFRIDAALGEEDRLVRSGGPYRFMPNPIYTSMLLVLSAVDRRRVARKTIRARVSNLEARAAGLLTSFLTSRREQAELADPTAADYYIVLIEDRGLTGRDRALGFGKSHQDFIGAGLGDGGRRGLVSMTNFHRHLE